MKSIFYIYSWIVTLLLPRISFAQGNSIAVPEPSTILLLGFAIIGLGAFLFWKARKNND